MHLFSTEKSRYSIWRSDLHERHKLLLKTGVNSFTGHPVEPWSAAAASSQTIGNVIRATQLSSSVSAHQQPAFRQHKQTGHLHTSPAQGSVWRGSKVGWECLSLSIVYHIHSVVSPLLSILSSNSLSPYNIYFDRLSRGNHPWDSVESRRDFQKFENTKWKVLCTVPKEKEWNHIEVGHFNIKSLW